MIKDYVKYNCICGQSTTYGIFRRRGTSQWNIISCCGGGCYSAIDIKFCPFCGVVIQ